MSKKNRTNKSIEQFIPSGFKEHVRRQHNFQLQLLKTQPLIKFLRHHNYPWTTATYYAPCSTVQTPENELTRQALTDT